jgi:hypothetical protein
LRVVKALSKTSRGGRSLAIAPDRALAPGVLVYTVDDEGSDDEA